MFIFAFTSKWRTHYLFVGLLLAAVAFSTALKIVEGEHILSATISAIRELNPTEIVMFVALWYSVAFRPATDEWPRTITTLDLQDTNR